VGRPGLPIRLVVGLHLLKHIEGLSDEAVCERWERDPYMQYFCGEEYFQHSFPLERSGMMHFRRRVGEQALLQEKLAAAFRTGASSVRATEGVAVDKTVQEKAIAPRLSWIAADGDRDLLPTRSGLVGESSGSQQRSPKRLSRHWRVVRDVWIVNEQRRRLERFIDPGN
jgi:hypothetical protein